MSRIGRNPITVPADVTVSVAGDDVTVKGPNATMTRTIPDGHLARPRGRHARRRSPQ